MARQAWVGHDWGSPVVWNMALHHPEVVHGVASLCVPMGFEEGVEALIPHVNRDIYPEAEYPKGQWDYQYFYQESFEVAQNEMEVDPYRLVKALFRKGSPEGVGKPAGTAVTRKNGGWFGKDGPPICRLISTWFLPRMQRPLWLRSAETAFLVPIRGT